MTTPTTTESIADLLERRANLIEVYRDIRDALNKTEYQIIATMREKYPDEWKDWERGRRSFQAEGVTVPVERSYDPDKLKAEMGEEFPDLVTTETKTVTKVDGNAAKKLWSDAAYARRLEACLLPPSAPKIKVVE